MENAHLKEILKYYQTRLDDRGRIYIPKKMRKKLSIRSGDVLYIKLEDNELKILAPT